MGAKLRLPGLAQTSILSLDADKGELFFPRRGYVRNAKGYTGPMITVLLIRHGIAEDAKSPDSERALTVEGWEKTRAAMRGLVQRGYQPTRGISSPYRRAAETLVCLKEATASGFPLGYCDILKPGTPPAKVETWLRGELADATEGSVLALVSHEPLLSSLVRHLTRRSLEVKKASCTVLHWDGQGFELAVHLTPAELREG